MTGSDAERATIGAVLLDSSILPLLDGLVDAHDFSDGRLDAMWSGIQSMRVKGEPIDVLSVGGRLSSWGIAGIDPVVLHQWVSDTPYAHAGTEYARIVREDALRRRIRLTAGVMLAKVDSMPPGELISAAITDMRQSSELSAGKVLRAKNLQDILALESSFDWVVPGLLEARDRIVLTGGEGSGKSTMVRQFAVAVSAGVHPFALTPITPKRVLVVDAENSEAQWRRAVKGILSAAKLMGSHNPGDMKLACVPRIDLTRDHDLAQIHRMVDDWDPHIVIIGPLYRLIGRAINSDDEAAPLLAALDTIRDRGIALMIEAHAGHALNQGGERDLRPRGSSALMGWPEFGFGLRTPKPGDNEFRLVRWRGDREQREWPEKIYRGGEFPWTTR